MRVGLVTGQVADDERTRLRERFRRPNQDPESLEVLLSSEVGCEGLDYEFCDRLVNYDIPWNPMRIEQRIGRIDRFGQPSDKVLIYNFITPGTVEERIFFRCFERLSVFRETVGDLEEVLGEAVKDLNRLTVDPRLTSDQVATRSRQIADNALRRVEEQWRLEEQGRDLLGLDDSFTADVTDLRAEGRYVAADELRHLVQWYVESPSLRLNRDARGTLLEQLVRINLRHADPRFTRWLVSLPLTRK